MFIDCVKYIFGQKILNATPSVQVHKADLSMEHSIEQKYYSKRCSQNSSYLYKTKQIHNFQFAIIPFI